MSILPESNFMLLFPVGLSEVQSLSWGFLTCTTLKDNTLRAVMSIPGDMILSAVETVVYRMQCEVHEKGDPLKEVWCYDALQFHLCNPLGSSFSVLKRVCSEISFLLFICLIPSCVNYNSDAFCPIGNL
ncbi:hypothetical protein AVEN_127001-1 [Araneus ventricosus]|uniref:Uncharacterized protein n=1 Tax=Araneus ventricosus TaxID=182803 RepID=A0A4Y2C0M9_ARAVE|nr:hypothetical protein AVEN_127001-1 [Araneus ventricosus]